MSNQSLKVDDLDDDDIARLTTCVTNTRGFWEVRLTRGRSPYGRYAGKRWAYVFWSGGSADTVPIISLARADGFYHMRVWDILTYCEDRKFENTSAEHVSDAFLSLHNWLDELAVTVFEGFVARGESIIQIPVDASVGALFRTPPDQLRRTAGKLREVLKANTDDSATMWLRALASDLDLLAENREQSFKHAAVYEPTTSSCAQG